MFNKIMENMFRDVRENRRKELMLKVIGKPIILLQFAPANLSVEEKNRKMRELENAKKLYKKQLEDAEFKTLESPEKARYSMHIFTQDSGKIFVSAIQFFTKKENGKWQTRTSKGDIKLIDEIHAEGIEFDTQDSSKNIMMPTDDAYAIYFR